RSGGRAAGDSEPAEVRPESLGRNRGRADHEKQVVYFRDVRVQSAGASRRWISQLLAYASRLQSAELYAPNLPDESGDFGEICASIANGDPHHNSERRRDSLWDLARGGAQLHEYLYLAGFVGFHDLRARSTSGPLRRLPGDRIGYSGDASCVLRPAANHGQAG